MAFQVGKREKIFIGVILLVGCIAALHLLLFKSLHDSLTSSATELTAARALMPPNSTPQNAPQLMETYKAETDKIQQQYDQIVAGMGLRVSDEWLLGLIFMDPAQYAISGETQVAQKLLDDLHAIQQFQAANPTLRLSFLMALGTAPERHQIGGWAMPAKLSDAFLNAPDQLAAILKEIRDLRGVLEQSKQSGAQDQVQKWQSLLDSKLEALTQISAADRAQVALVAGESVNLLRMLVLTDLIRAAQPSATAGEIRKTLGISLNAVEAYKLHRQLQGVLKLLDLAKQSGIEEIPQIKLDGERFMIFNPDWLKAETPLPAGATPATPTPAAAPLGSEAPGGGYGAPIASAGGAAPVAPGQTPASAEEQLASTYPITIFARGPNDAVTKFLYAAANCELGMDIRSLDLAGPAVAGGDGKTFARADIMFPVLLTFGPGSIYEKMITPTPAPATPAPGGAPAPGAPAPGAPAPGAATPAAPGAPGAAIPSPAIPAPVVPAPAAPTTAAVAPPTPAR